ncbi:sulfur carrier protein ThiS [Corynebacterium sp. H130]|uniref:sulfur carrier protein ThiS n=1 Tax=Corynebacterium sp. H130 TaxID=3133444 RepID=UPI0030B084A7
MTVVNGTHYEAAADETIADLVMEMIGRVEGVAVAVDGAVVPRSTWADTPVAGTIEIVTAAQGG